MRPLLAALALLCALACPAGAETVSGLPLVVDGDSLRFPGVEVRLFGIDAPELAQPCGAPGREWPCGRVSADRLRTLISGRPVVCTGIDQPDGTQRDRYGRLLGRCSVGGVEINGWMVENGHALAFRRYSLDYVTHEGRARAAGVGMWAGTFIAPWEWRAAKRAGQ